MDSSKKTGIANIIRFYSAWRGMNSGLAGIFAITIIGVFPLVFRDYYFDILNFKTIFYYKTVIILAVVFLIVNGTFLILSIYLAVTGLRAGAGKSAPLTGPCLILY